MCAFHSNQSTPPTTPSPLKLLPSVSSLGYLFPSFPHTFSDPPVFPFFGSAQISPPGSLLALSKLKQNQSSSFKYGITLLLNPGHLPNAQWEAKQTDTLGALSRERFIAELNKDKQGALCSKSPTTQKRFYKQNLGGGLKGWVTLFFDWLMRHRGQQKFNHQFSKFQPCWIHACLA